MRVIGLTGGTGSGKGLVSSFLKEKGAYIVDCDEIAHEIIKKGKCAYIELVNFFGTEILDENGEIMRGKLGNIVFSDGSKRAFLNECTHRYIGIKVNEQVEYAKEKGYTILVIDAPLLLESNIKYICDEIWGVYSDERIRMKRIMARDNISEEYAKSRLSAQKSWDKIKESADVVIYNNGDISEIKKQVERYL
ncbi:MAG: dephospho-CoA kinase [Lachnospiraceae bacterium]|nr:dephospho-CoA kinase [Lachnospiraceae bacterium]